MNEGMSWCVQMAEQMCWHSDYWGEVQNRRGERNEIMYNLIHSAQFITVYGFVGREH